MFRPRVVIVTLLVLLVLIFVVQNSEVVAVRLLFWELEMSRVILILIATATGLVCGYLIARVADPLRNRSDSRD